MLLRCTTVQRATTWRGFSRALAVATAVVRAGSSRFYVYLCVLSFLRLTYENLLKSISKHAEIVKKMSALTQQADGML